MNRLDRALKDALSPTPDDAPLTTAAKALALNLDPATYGGFAEIGGGQEVARWFFSVGSAATGVAKAVSAHDMAVSDALYGPTQRYVSRQRLEAMLEYELDQLIQQLGPRRGDTTTFFVFADTVATRSRGRVEHGHGWMGVRFQAQPRESPSEIVLHVNLLDANAQHEKEALGIVGVNLLYAAFYQRASPESLITSLMHDLSRQRIEIDMIRFSGPAFVGLDHRLMALQLVQQGLTDAAMFRATGEVVQPSEVLHRRPILVTRGSFRPATNLTCWRALSSRSSVRLRSVISASTTGSSRHSHARRAAAHRSRGSVVGGDGAAHRGRHHQDQGAVRPSDG